MGKRRMCRTMARRVFKKFCVLTQWLLKPVLFIEYRFPEVKTINERPTEYAFVFRCLSQICPEEILDVGTGRTALPSLMANCGFRVTAIDNRDSYWRGDFANHHYWVKKDDITKPKIGKRFDLITCISVIEHIAEHRVAMAQMFNLLKPEGFMILTFPYNENQYSRDVYRIPGSPYPLQTNICQVFSRSNINTWLGENNAKIVIQEYHEVFTGDLWSFGERICPPNQVTKQDRCHLTCVLLQKSSGRTGSAGTFCNNDS